MVKNLPAVQKTQEMRVQSQDREDPLEEGMATHSSILAWTTPWTGARWAVVHGATKGQTLLEQLSTSTHTVILRLHGHSDRFDARTVPVTFHSIAMVMLPAYPKIFSSVSITSNSLLLLPQGIFNLLFRDPGPRKIQKALGKLLRNKETGHKGSTHMDAPTHRRLYALLLLLLRHVSRVRLSATPQTAANQAPLSLGFSRQEHWSGLPFPSPMHESEK